MADKQTELHDLAIKGMGYHEVQHRRVNGDAVASDISLSDGNVMAVFSSGYEFSKRNSDDEFIAMMRSRISVAQ
jgi:hypothetical protein